MEEPKKMSAADAIAARQQLMKDQAAAMRSIQEKLKTGQIQAIAAGRRDPGQDVEADADHVSRRARSNPATSRAKPDIWQKWPEFEGYCQVAGSEGHHSWPPPRGPVMRRPPLPRSRISARRRAAPATTPSAVPRSRSEGPGSDRTESHDEPRCAWSGAGP